MKNFILLCCLVASAALLFSQPVRDALAALNAPAAMRQHLAGRKLFLTNFKAAPTARFAAYDGRDNAAVRIDDDTWLATGLVDYHWQGSWRRDRWSCAFDPRTRDVVAWEVGKESEATPEFTRTIERLRSAAGGGREQTSAARAIERAWGWRER